MSSAKTTDAEAETSAITETSKDKPGAPATFMAKVMELRPVRAAQRYGKARGALLAGGIAYSALFSIVAALTIAWSVFMATLGGDAELRGQVIGAVNQVLPGILDDGSGTGMVNPDSLVLDSAINPVSIIAALVALWTAISIMTNIRSAVQDMFGIATPAENFAVQKVRDLLGFIAMAVGILLSSVLGTVAGTMGQTILDAIGLGNNPVTGFVLQVVGLLVAAGVATLTFAFLFTVTAHVRALPKDLWLGSAIGGVAVQLVLTLGTSLVSSVADDPLLAASAGLATLLLFVNLLSRVLLLVAAFTANPPSPTMPENPEQVHYNETPNHVTMSAPHTLKWSFQGATGQVQVDPARGPDVDERKDARTGTPRGGDVRPGGRRIAAEHLSAEQRDQLLAEIIPLEEKVVAMRAQLGQRPRIDIAEREYWGRRDIIEERHRDLVRETAGGENPYDRIENRPSAN